jgi:NAD(P)-dependent dehydrogenase (short-subunit alcohol dehydrogenase family)
VSSLQGKVALITGGANGIGAATAAQLAARGAKLVLVDLDAGLLREAAERLGAENAASVVGDVTELADMERAVAHAVERFGGLDVVIANAGIASYGSVATVDPATFRRVIDVNVTGVFHTVRAALPQLLERKGYVLVVSSAAAYGAAPGLAAYNASKAGVEHFANALRIELGFQGVAVGSAHMSWIETPLVQDAKDDLVSFREMLKTLPGPMGKTTTVEACAEAFAHGIEKRSTRVNVPGWVGATRWLKPALTSKIMALLTRRDAKRIVPMMDEEVARLGRSASARVKVPEAAEEPSDAGVSSG